MRILYIGTPHTYQLYKEGNHSIFRLDISC